MEFFVLALWIAPTPLSVFWWCYECGMFDDNDITGGTAGALFAALFVALGCLLGLLIGPFGALIFGGPMLYAKLTERRVH